MEKRKEKNGRENRNAKNTIKFEKRTEKNRRNSIIKPIFLAMNNKKIKYCQYIQNCENLRKLQKKHEKSMKLHVFGDIKRQTVFQIVDPEFQSHVSN